MLNAIIQIVVFAVSIFILSFSIRMGMNGADKMDTWLISKSGRNYDGFNWFFRIPLIPGVVPEFFYRTVLGRKNYFKTNWWSLKLSSFLAVLLFVALLKTRSGVANYYTLAFLGEKGISAFFTSGVFVWYLNFVSLMYIALGGVIMYESVKMAGIYAPVRILYYGVLCLLMANLTIVILAVIVFLAVVYFVFKVITFLFLNQRKKYMNTDEIDLGGDKIMARFRVFKAELIDWENQLVKNKPEKDIKKTTRRKPTISRKRTQTRVPRSSSNFDDIPRFHPD
jgi:hypothetical protein